jgi:hypothetical protein
MNQKRENPREVIVRSQVASSKKWYSNVRT